MRTDHFAGFVVLRLIHYVYVFVTKKFWEDGLNKLIAFVQIPFSMFIHLYVCILVC